MRLIAFLVVFTFMVVGCTAFSDINRIDIKDPGRAAKGLALLYMDIGKGAAGFARDLFMALDDVPRAILTDIFGIGRKND